ncbi:hypothetical protein LTR37_012796 [Vermiconidia calcicola]|uniref:Uncharacterized protein n=1 Tax=Vermiconidia calcicola TaxID=1690605 RepID=A0ACC3MYQ1_9PEZI|nr:hypothetical protein LTR37_012796 [Vermiconidia calcicola]
MQSEIIQEILGQLQQLCSVKGTGINEKAARRQACELARKLSQELEEPGDLIDRIIHQPGENAMLRLAQDLGIYAHLVQADGSVSCENISTATGADVVLMRRILRCLAALGHIDEKDVDVFAANKFSMAFVTPKGIAGSKFAFETATPAWNAMPAYLKSIGFKNPENSHDAPLQRGFGSQKHMFELLVEHGVLENFQTFMTSYRADREEFLDIFPARERLLDGSQDDSVLLVDIGGGRGHDIEKILEQLPDTKGRMVLQEVGDVVKQVSESDAMKVMVHDFFTPQPIQAARVYYLRMILHDWPDEQCVDILKNVVSAMKPGYSKVLVSDVVLPDKGATRFAAQSDIVMMCLLAGMERNETQWRQLFDRAGLKIIDIWRSTPESVIEAELAEQ